MKMKQQHEQKCTHSTIDMKDGTTNEQTNIANKMIIWHD